MRDNNNLFTIMQNVVVGTIALQSFTYGYYKVAKNKPHISTYPKLGYMFYVLPIVYNQNCLERFKNARELYKVLLEDRTIILELQERANKMSTQTFDSLNLAFSKKILGYSANNTIVLEKGFTSSKLILPSRMIDLENPVKKIQDCAYKLGAIFAKRSELTIQNELNIKF